MPFTAADLADLKRIHGELGSRIQAIEGPAPPPPPPPPPATGTDLDTGGCRSSCRTRNRSPHGRRINDNVAANQPLHGFLFMAGGPFTEFRGNECYGGRAGMTMWYINGASTNSPNPAPHRQASPGHVVGVVPRGRIRTPSNTRPSGCR